jgi:septum formation protein
VHTQVEFRTLSARDLDGYLASGEWRGKAGAYAVQGIGAGLVRAVRGSYTNVVGLPLVEVLEALEAEHVALAALERGSAA